MGINPTRTPFKTFTFDGENSKDYGVYITGGGVFNAPERNVEMVSIAGRNGAYALDHGNFNNIEVTYPAGIFADNAADFAEALSELRNFLCSKVGYVRLEDDYNPNEYRMAVYKGGLEVSNVLLLAGEFEITFECKPQRFLKSGETAISVTSGDTITNPTLFDAKPQIQTWGYGSISVGGSVINVNDVDLGDVIVRNAVNFSQSGNLTSWANTFGYKYYFLNNSNDIYYNGATVDVQFSMGNAYTIVSASIDSVTNGSATIEYSTKSASIHVVIDDHTFQCANNESYVCLVTYTATVEFGGTQTTQTKTIQITTGYYVAGTHRFDIAVNINEVLGFKTNYKAYHCPAINALSTKSALGSPTYIDLDIGAAWQDTYGDVVDLNRAVELPAELPTLPNGATTITFDNTFLSVDIVPRWWQV